MCFFQRTDRHVFLLDGLAVCCKQKIGVLGMYRLKEKINLRQIKLVDLEDSESAGEGEIHNCIVTVYMYAYKFF